MNPELTKIVLKPGEERRILAGHLWIFSNEIAKAGDDAKAGDAVSIETADGRLIGTGFYNPSSLIACRLFSREATEPDSAFFYERLFRCLLRRKQLLPEQTAYRLCFGESDGLPGLVADRYDDFIILQILSAGMERRLDIISDALRKILNPKGIFLKNDRRMRSLEGLPLENKVLWGTIPERTIIKDGGLEFQVPLTDGQKTGFYFDQRDSRAFLRRFYTGKTVLDLYCYSGAFAIDAVKAGAKAALGVDSSAQAVALARENAALNGAGSEIAFEEGDAEEALESFALKEQPLKPDLIVLDPPSLAPGRKDLPKALRRYAKINAQAMAALEPGGLLATSTCSHHVDRESFLSMLRSAQAKAGRGVKLLRLGAQAADHPILLAMPETEYLHFALLEID
ncbi:MAG: class I SAM-dependent rRNA methyltransferase [Elusimicrobiota bacterium]